MEFRILISLIRTGTLVFFFAPILAFLQEWEAIAAGIVPAANSGYIPDWSEPA
jgi:hypothetical protein